MEENPTLIIADIEEQLRRFPAAVLEEYRVSRSRMSASLTEPQVVEWADIGADVARQTVRSWEAATHYFRVSPQVAGSVSFGSFSRWARQGSALCRESPSLATAYFQASPATVKRLKSRHLEAWADLGRSLYKGTWKSNTLSCKFFEASPVLLESLTFEDMERFVSFLDSLSRRSYDVTSECLVLGQRLFPLVGDDKGAFLSLASAMVDKGWRQVKSFFEAGARALPRIEARQRMRFLKLAESLVRDGGTNVPGVMVETSQALAEVDPKDHDHILTLAETLLETSLAAVPEFVKSCPQVLQRITVERLDRWFEEGLGILRQNSEGGLAFFRVESARSEHSLEALSSAVDLSRVRDVLEMYCRALAGAELKLSESGDLVGKNIGWVAGEAPSTEGSTVFLPPMVDRYPTKEQNFSWLKVVSTHQVAHLEFGSFGFDFERPSALFHDLRHSAEDRRLGQPSRAQADPPPEDGGVERAWLTDMQRFFDLFEDRKLALDVFTVVEDGRLDARVKDQYRGIRTSYSAVQRDSLGTRPDIRSLPAREALVELLVRLSLHQQGHLATPEPYVEEARRVSRIAARVLVPQAMVEDSAEAALRIYAVLSAIPNAEVPQDDWEDMDLDAMEGGGALDEDDVELILEQFGQPVESMGEDDAEYQQAQDVDYRGDFKPELAQLLAMLRLQRDGAEGQTGGQPISREMLEELLKNSAELDFQAAEGDIDQSSGLFANNLLREAGMRMPPSDQAGQGAFVHVDDQGAPLDASEPQTFVYDEWDFRADDYKPRWCIVRQKGMAEGDPAYFAQTLHAYGSLVGQIRRQFEMLVPEMFRKVTKLEDGEDISIDDVVEAFVDIRTGAQPSDKIFWRRNKVQRDVAVVFLLDTSASTAEAIDDTRRLNDDWDPPDDPVEYMLWLRARRGEGTRRSYKRIIDVEKEAVVLLINALEAVGDVYGIYGFSGYGRENVEFYTIKDIEENLSERVKMRIDRIAPLHATRMGPAIRHATYKLANEDARTKLLFLISDGRPQDRGYSREGVEKEYAVHDTRMAFEEARRQNIQPFCLTVDKNGHDYLGTMCQDIGYEVLHDIYTLPQRLLFLYKRLTM